jgi:ubiquinol-cytochrome c reductase cytochrome b subunit
MAEAFMGYLLPWGQMSYWGAQVIINLFSAIPFIGPDLSTWIRGDYVVGDATLNRFFAFHVIAVPLVLLGLVVAHIFALHDVGSNNPDGVEIKGPGAAKDANGHPVDGIPFHPYYTVHDILGVSVFLLVFSAIVFFAPEFGGYFLEANNFIPADSLKTPLHIAPVWYFTPFYSMLRAITSEMMYALSVILVLGIGYVLVRTRASSLTKGLLVVLMIAFLWMFNAFGFTGSRLLQGLDAKFWGVLVMIGSVLTMFFLPWLDRSPVKSIRYRPGWHKAVIGVFVVDFLVLAYLGTEPPTPIGNLISQIGTLFYFGFFWLMPWWTRLGEFKTVPQRITFAAH